jgi:hypothetical protein
VGVERKTAVPEDDPDRVAAALLRPLWSTSFTGAATHRHRRSASSRFQAVKVAVSSEL